MGDEKEASKLLLINTDVHTKLHEPYTF